MLLDFAVQTGLRVSELTAVRRCDLGLGRGAQYRFSARDARKAGRLFRATPWRLWTRGLQNVAEIVKTRSSLARVVQLFPARDAVRKLVVKHTQAAAARCGLAFRQDCRCSHPSSHLPAMTLLRHHVDLATIALWLGHEDLRTVQIYLHADLAMKEQALARITPPNNEPGRYRPSDTILAFLESL